MPSDPRTRFTALGAASARKLRQVSKPLATLKEAGLVDLVETLPPTQRYTCVFEGNAQVLDPILVSANLKRLAEYDVVHLTAEFADQTSDHDPDVARLAIGPARR